MRSIIPAVLLLIVLTFGASATAIIDAGHGSPDGGAVGAAGTVEKDCNLAVALYTDEFLTFLGVPHALTRSGDEAIYPDGAATIREKKVGDIKNRVEFAASYADPVFVSIHMNTSPARSCEGAQIFFAPKDERSRECAELIRSDFLRLMPDTRVRELAKTPRTVYLFEHLDCRAVLIECGFLSNADEERKLADDAYRKKLAFAIACGVADASRRK